ncbi:unnamed protein product [Ambrosiozyma monospora]|uniref:Unnamed protein product n=1 Tax=Ambrosiozyma monospora TaxID=43982 RepID=A0ACB5TC65_AMBMO|nr:unnamed protein product [Ambrosiozyma monospora]
MKTTFTKLFSFIGLLSLFVAADAATDEYSYTTRQICHLRKCSASTQFYRKTTFTDNSGDLTTTYEPVDYIPTLVTNSLGETTWEEVSTSYITDANGAVTFVLTHCEIPDATVTSISTGPATTVSSTQDTTTTIVRTRPCNSPYSKTEVVTLQTSVTDATGGVSVSSYVSTTAYLTTKLCPASSSVSSSPSVTTSSSTVSSILLL